MEKSICTIRIFKWMEKVYALWSVQKRMLEENMTRLRFSLILIIMATILWQVDCVTLGREAVHLTHIQFIAATEIPRSFHIIICMLTCICMETQQPITICPHKLNNHFMVAYWNYSISNNRVLLITSWMIFFLFGESKRMKDSEKYRYSFLVHVYCTLGPMYQMHGTVLR